ncbi:MAG: rRNA maturation RNase YbeY [Neisseriaceae bacterium]|nr:MAG: rRNA maturation RNase YbeY [Neisseriaceae bacterium]
MLNFSYTSLVKSVDRPDRNLVAKIIRRSLQQSYSVVSLSIVIVDNETSQNYNLEYRNKNKPTNVISLECAEQRSQFNMLTGELILADEVIRQEALEQNKSVVSHYVHMLVHGVLHLQGFDHQNDLDAEKMEQIEIDIMASLGYSNPYTI